MTTLRTLPFAAQQPTWPASGRHILAQYDAECVVVYQAYKPSIGRFTAAHGYFGGGWSLGRMSWIKPNFLWMMYRCGWATKPGQDVVLAIWIARAAFDELLAAAVPSSFHAHRYADRDAWQAAVAASEVRMQWDPDHGPRGEPLERRALQLGLRGAALAKFARPWIRKVEDITPFVIEAHRALEAGGTAALVTPAEQVYLPSTETAFRIGVGAWASHTSARPDGGDDPQPGKDRGR